MARPCRSSHDPSTERPTPATSARRLVLELQPGKPRGPPLREQVAVGEDVARAAAFYERAFGWPRRVDEEVYVEFEAPNGMLVGVLDLVTDATERINAVQAALDAERDFWLAEVELQRAMSGVGVSG